MGVGQPEGCTARGRPFPRDNLFQSKTILQARRQCSSTSAVVSPHTALYAAPNGMTCWLAEGIGAGTRRAVHPADEVRPSEAFELVINVPRDAMDAVREAAASAGASAGVGAAPPRAPATAEASVVKGRSFAAAL